MNLIERIKTYYENVFNQKLPRRTNYIIRIDGKKFSKYTKNFKKPFDDRLNNIFNETAKHLCENIQGCKIAYVQSDEISLWLTDYDSLETSAWFDGKIQKICSVSSSMGTGIFNYLIMKEYGLETKNIANFDSRVFIIPEIEEVINYFISRQKDATRNSISMLGRTYFSHKELQNKSSNQIQEMLFQQKNINWNDYPIAFKRGSIVKKEQFMKDNVIRNKWDIKEAPLFTKDKKIIKNIYDNLKEE